MEKISITLEQHTYEMKKLRRYIDEINEENKKIKFENEIFRNANVMLQETYLRNKKEIAMINNRKGNILKISLVQQEQISKQKLEIEELTLQLKKEKSKNNLNIAKKKSPFLVNLKPPSYQESQKEKKEEYFSIYVQDYDISNIKRIKPVKDKLTIQEISKNQVHLRKGYRKLFRVFFKLYNDYTEIYQKYISF